MHLLPFYHSFENFKLFGLAFWERLRQITLEKVDRRIMFKFRGIFCLFNPFNYGQN